MLSDMKLPVLLACIAIGAAAGGLMIVTHTGPGITHRPQPASPQSRNDTRTTLLRQLASALTQYQKDHGNLPVTIPPHTTQICSSFGDNCQNVRLIDLSFLTTQGNYVPTIPEDPLGGQGKWGSGFFIQKTSDSSYQLTAPEAELGKTIAVNFTL